MLFHPENLVLAVGISLATLAGCSSETLVQQGSAVAAQAVSSSDSESDADPPPTENPEEPDAVPVGAPAEAAGKAAAGKPAASNIATGHNVAGPHKKHRANRLANETSPYLLMHAYNPVDWYPWGKEAFEKAQKENKPIFLSVGYSSCYWCHVMERESFMDEEIAKYLNEHFICIKVDREERPDVDDIYMLAVQITQRGAGGWPMSVFLTPQAKPFWGGTYFPARQGDRGTRIGFLQLIEHWNQEWHKNPEEIQQRGDYYVTQIAKQLHEQNSNKPETLTAALVDNVQAGLASSFDKEEGGFGFAPFDDNRPK
ncbi:MAG: thioredoxin domain-containing protein, partial [Planctomycetales bacterium]